MQVIRGNSNLTNGTPSANFPTNIKPSPVSIQDALRGFSSSPSKKPASAGKPPQDRPSIKVQVAIRPWVGIPHHTYVEEGDLLWTDDETFESRHVVRNYEHVPTVINHQSFAHHLRDQGVFLQKSIMEYIDTKLKKNGQGIRSSFLANVINYDASDYGVTDEGGDDHNQEQGPSDEYLIEDDDDYNGTNLDGSGEDAYGMQGRTEDVVSAEALARLKKLRLRERLNRFRDIIDDDDSELVIDLMELEHHARMKDSNHDEYYEEWQSFNSIMERRERLYMRNLQRLRDASDMDQSEFENNALARNGGVTGMIQETLEEVKGRLPEIYKKSIEDWVDDPNQRYSRLLYDMNSYYSDNLIYLSPFLIKKHWNFCGSAYTDMTNTGLSRSFDPLRSLKKSIKGIGVIKYGWGTCRNLISSSLIRGDKIEVSLLREYDVQAGRYTWVKPAFSVDTTYGTARFQQPIYEDNYVDHKTGKRKRTIVLPGTRQNNYHIGSVQHHENRGSRAQGEQFATSQGVYPDATGSFANTLKNALDVRKDLPDIVLQIKQ